MTAMMTMMTTAQAKLSKFESEADTVDQGGRKATPNYDEFTKTT